MRADAPFHDPQIGTPALFFLLLRTKKAIVSPRTEDIASSILDRRDSYRENADGAMHQCSSVTVRDDDNQEAVFLAKQAESFAYYSKTVKYGPTVGELWIDVPHVPQAKTASKLECDVSAMT